MKTSFVKWVVVIFFVFGLCVLLVPSIFPDFIFPEGWTSSNASNFGEAYGGIIGTIFLFLSVVLIIWTLSIQATETAKNAVIDQFFKMLDYHNNNVNILKVSNVIVAKHNEISENRRVFVIFKIQLHKLLSIVREINTELQCMLSEREIIDIAYIIFYYGIDKGWMFFIKDKLANYKFGDIIAEKLLEKKEELKEEIKIGRTNQTSLSSYFRNMYNAIKLIDSSKYLTDKEKKQYVTILRAQLSNPELYILFFNLLSRFGKKWIEKEYVKKYEFIRNIPLRYCDGFEPSDYFDITFEEDDL